MARIKEMLERELKLGAATGFRLPALPGAPLERRVFTSTYYDTADRRLARAEVTLRRRVEHGKGLWQLKLPRGGARLELELPGGPSRPPGEIRDLLSAYLRDGELLPVAKLRTRRGGIRVHENGRPVADVTMDTVAVMVDGRVARTFRELEAELVDGSEKALRRVEKALRRAGAGDGDTRPKLFQALDLPATPAQVPPAPDAPPLEHVRAAFETQYRAILAHDPGTRLGTDPEELHQMRVATRRMRAFLRAARPLLDVEWAESLRSELAFLGGALGPVRDLDVLIEHLREDVARLEPGEQRALRRLFDLLEAERDEARAAMLEALRGDRYLELLVRLEEAAQAPHAAGTTDASLREIAAAEFRRLRRAVHGLERDPDDEALHEIRIKGKRARYAAELAEAAVGKRATRFVAEAKLVQDVLGAHQDAAVAEEKVRALLARAGGSRIAFAAGRLVEREQARRLEARIAFPAAWKRLERRGREAWA